MIWGPHPYFWKHPYDDNYTLLSCNLTLHFWYQIFTVKNTHTHTQHNSTKTATKVCPKKILRKGTVEFFRRAFHDYMTSQHAILWVDQAVVILWILYWKDLYGNSVCFLSQELVKSFMSFQKWNPLEGYFLWPQSPWKKSKISASLLGFQTMTQRANSGLTPTIGQWSLAASWLPPLKRSESCQIKRDLLPFYMGVEPKIGGFYPPNHPFLIGFSLINHPFWGIPIFGNIYMDSMLQKTTSNFTPPTRHLRASAGARFVQLCLPQRQCGSLVATWFIIQLCGLVISEY